MKILMPLAVILLLIPLVSITQDIPPRPDPPRLVNDLADILNSRQEQSLERKLRQFNDTTSNQITVVTVKSLEGYDPSMFAYQIGEKWRVGQKEFDNGIVVLVKPKYGSDRGQAYIAVGYGLEPAIPDAIAKRIVEHEMIPSFRNNDYYGGLDDATNVLMQMAAGEITAEGYNDQISRSPIFAFLPFLAIMIIFFLIRSSRRRAYNMGQSSLPFWTALWLGSTIGRSHSGSWNGFTGGGSGFGGGGGFGGFGGGSFGGGGAGGSW